VAITYHWVYKMKKDILAFISGALIFSTLLVLGNTVLADTIIPIYPSCSEFYGQDGDKAHYDSGFHQIVGAGLLEGADDVEVTVDDVKFGRHLVALRGQRMQVMSERMWRTRAGA